jgi:hypothetical protein
MRGPTLLALCAASLVLPRSADAQPRCAGDGPWVALQLGTEGWSEAQRAEVLSDLQHTLAGQGIAACSGDAHPAAAPLATLAVELSPQNRATVDIEVRDAVTHKRVRRDVDLTPIPEDGRPAAIAIEADELLRASWAEVALDTARARQAETKPQVTASVGQVLAPARVAGGGALGARGAFEHYFGGVTLFGADAFGRLQLSPRWALELGGELRAGPAVTAPHGRVSTLAAGGSATLLARVAGGRRASLSLGAGGAASWLSFRPEPTAGASGSSYANLLAVARLRVIARLALGRSVHGTAGVDGGVALRGVEATDAGDVVARASGVSIGATLGLEAP